VIRFETIVTTEGFAALKPSWDRLAAAGAARHMFQNFDWPWRTWTCMASHSGARLHILVGQVAGEVVLIWPLVVQRRELRFLSTGMTEYHDVLVAPSPMADAWIDAAWQLLRRAPGVDTALFYDVLAESNLARLLARNRAASYRMDRHSWVVRLDGRDWPTYLASRKAGLRSDQARQWRRVAALPIPASYHEVTALADVLATVDWLFVHKLAWMAQRGLNAAVFGSAAHQSFVRAILTDAQASGTLIVGQLRSGPTILSAGYGFVTGDEFMFYQFAYDSAYASYSPSRLLLERLLHACFSRGLHRFDFLPGAMPYKGIWATEEPPIGDHFIALTALGRLKLQLHARLIGGMAKQAWLVRQYRRLPLGLRQAIRWKMLPSMDYSADIRRSDAPAGEPSPVEAAPAAVGQDAAPAAVGQDAAPAAVGQDAAARPPR
jgi:CelD/BcsL family acetyltransferase involved in cellulose biosynthesis